MSLPRLVLRVVVMYLALISFTYARIDAMELRLLEPYWEDLRWDNIESAPEWVNGVEPQYLDAWEMHRVVLAPKQQTTFLLPAYETVRLYHPKLILKGQELDVYISNGSGLAVKQVMQTSTDGHSLVLSPNSAVPLLIHVVRPPALVGNFHIALFVSRKVPLKAIAPYRNLLWSSARWCLLKQEPFALPELYNEFPALQKQSFDVTGPVRLALKNRLHYGQLVSELIQDYRIRYWLDNNAPKELNFSTSVETSRIITVNTGIEVVGREEQDYLEIPEGQHKLVLQADRPLYIQVLAQTEDDYLFTSLNNPRLPVEEIRKQGLLPTTELMLEAQKAKAIVQDNSRQAGGMNGSHLLQQAALKRQDYPPGLTEAEQLRGFRTFYRDLLPTKKSDKTAQFMAYFLSEAIHAINRPQSDAILAEQLLTEALKRVGSGFFTSLSGEGLDTANEYSLPEQQTYGTMRLIVDKRQCVPRLLRVEINAATVKDIWLRCEQDLEPEDFTRSLAETALISLQQQVDSFNVTLDALFSAHAQPAALIPTAVYEIPVPKDVRSIKLWQASKKSDTPVNIAVQYRSSKPFTFSEHSYLARLRDLKNHPINVAWFSNSIKNPPTKPSPAEQQLQNEWLPLQRLLQANFRLYKAAVANYPQQQAPLSASNKQLESDTAIAKSKEAQQQWLEALEQWGKVVNSSTGVTHQQAQLHQANALTQLGEDYLAESLRKFLTLNADAVVAEQAMTELGHRYQTQNNNAALLTLASAMFIQNASPENSRLLLTALMANGEYRFALLLGLSFVDTPPLESLLTAAYQLGWWETYQWLQEKLPPEQRAFWQGLKLQQQGDFDGALKAWSVATTKPWHDYLQRGLLLHEQLLKVTEQNALSLFTQWSKWQQQNPGGKVWQTALWHVKDYAGSDSYYAVERDVYSMAFRATTARPVVLSLLGPVTLNLQIRPLHPPHKPDSALDGWLQIIDNDAASRFPYINNLLAQGLRVTGGDDLQPGNQVNFSYQVGEGWHEIQLNSKEAPLSLSIEEQRPEFAVSVLPLLQNDTFAEMAFISRLNKIRTASDAVNGWQNLWR